MYFNKIKTYYSGEHPKHIWDKSNFVKVLHSKIHCSDKKNAIYKKGNTLKYWTRVIKY